MVNWGKGVDPPVTCWCLASNRPRRHSPSPRGCRDHEETKRRCGAAERQCGSLDGERRVWRNRELHRRSEGGAHRLGGFGGYIPRGGAGAAGGHHDQASGLVHLAPSAASSLVKAVSTPRTAPPGSWGHWRAVAAAPCMRLCTPRNSGRFLAGIVGIAVPHASLIPGKPLVEHRLS